MITLLIIIIIQLSFIIFLLCIIGFRAARLCGILRAFAKNHDDWETFNYERSK